MDMMASKRAFHTVIGWQMEVQSPVVLQRILGTTRIYLELDCSCVCPSLIDNKSIICDGAAPLTALKVNSKTLNLIRYSTDNKCRLFKTAVKGWLKCFTRCS